MCGPTAEILAAHACVDRLRRYRQHTRVWTDCGVIGSESDGVNSELPADMVETMCLYPSGLGNPSAQSKDIFWYKNVSLELNQGLKYVLFY